MGSDQRTGKGNKGYGNFEGARSDTTMLLHVYPDRESAVVVSIPRDTIVDLPECTDDDGTGRCRPSRDRFNVAFDRGGPGCTVKTVEAMTGLTVDHFVVLDFNGFKKTDRRPGRRRGVPDPSSAGRQVRGGPARRAHAGER